MDPRFALYGPSAPQQQQQQQQGGYVRFSASQASPQGYVPGSSGMPYGQQAPRPPLPFQVGGHDLTTASRVSSVRPSSEMQRTEPTFGASGYTREVPSSRRGPEAAGSYVPLPRGQTPERPRDEPVMERKNSPAPGSLGRVSGRKFTLARTDSIPQTAQLAREGSDEWNLIQATIHGKHTVVKDILNSRRAGFDIDARDPHSKRSALMIAARKNQLEIASSLIKGGASLRAMVEQGGQAGMTPLFLATLAGHLPMVALLLKAAREDIRRIIDFQHPVSKQTALMYSIIKGHGTITRLLVTEFSADKSLADHTGKTAFDYAGKYGGRPDGVNIFRMLEPRKEVCDASTDDGLSVVSSWVKLGPYCPVTELCDISKNKVHAAMLFAYAFHEAARKDQKLRAVLEAKSTESIQRAKEYLRAHVLKHGEESVIGLIQQRVSKKWSPLLLAQELHATDFMACDEVQDAVVKLWHGKVGTGSRFWNSIFVTPFARPFRFPGDPECFWGTPLGEFSLETLFYALFLAAYTAYMNLDTSSHARVANYLWWYLYLNILGTAGRIVQSIRSMGFAAFWGEFFNKLDTMSVFVFATALVFRIASVFSSEQKETLLRVQYEILAYAAVVMWMRLLRVCLLSATLGPLITMIRSMLVDLASFGLLLLVIVLGFGQTVYSVTRTEVLLFGRGQDGAEGGGEENPLEYFGLFFTLGGLFRALLGDVRFELIGNDTPTASVVLIGMYLVVGSVLLLNLLIAILSNTYARIQSASESEFKFGYSLTVLAYSQDVGVFPTPLNIVQMVLFWADPWDAQVGRDGDVAAANDGRRYRVTAAVTGLVFLVILAPFTLLYLLGSAIACRAQRLSEAAHIMSRLDLYLLGSREGADDHDDEGLEGMRDGLVRNAAPIAGSTKDKSETDGEEDLVGEEDEDSVFRSLARGVRDVDDKTMKRLVVETWERITGQGAPVTSMSRLRNLRARRQQQQAVPPPPPPPAPGAGYGVAGQQQVINIDLRNLETKMETILQGLRVCQSFRRHFMEAEGAQGGPAHA